MTSLLKGDRVWHWFAGTGSVRWVKRGSVSVRWDKGTCGLAHPKDCQLQPARNRPESGKGAKHGQ